MIICVPTGTLRVMSETPTAITFSEEEIVVLHATYQECVHDRYIPINNARGPPKGERLRRTLLYRKPSNRLGVKKTANYSISDDYDYGLSESMTVRAGFCPCSVCNHEFMWECEDEDCACCSSSCT